MTFASSSMRCTSPTRDGYFARAAGSPSTTPCASWYDMRAALRMTPSWNSERTTRPLPSISITTDCVSRSTPSTRLQTPEESACGSMGTTRSGKYTDVPRR